MDRLKQLQEWSIYEYGNVFFIEPPSRHEMIMEKINDVIDTYKPKIIVKVGLGSGRIVLDLINTKKDIKLVVVEPSLRIIEDFINENNDNQKIKDIGFVNGEFTSLPVDYYAADLIISIDNLDFQETAPVMDEFKRALHVDALFMFAGIVLDDDDVEGTYDDLMRIISPIHNDFYLKDDLKTFMNLKDFTFVKGRIEHFDYNIDEIKKHITGLYGYSDSERVEKFIKENSGILSEIYKLDGRNITLPYFTGLFMKRKA